MPHWKSAPIDLTSPIQIGMGLSLMCANGCYMPVSAVFYKGYVCCVFAEFKRLSVVLNGVASELQGKNNQFPLCCTEIGGARFTFHEICTIR